MAHLEKWADQYENEMIEYLLYFQRITEYSGDISTLLELPYNFFHKLVIKQTKIKNKENEIIEEQRTKMASKKNTKRYTRPRST